METVDTKLNKTANALFQMFCEPRLRLKHEVKFFIIDAQELLNLSHSYSAAIVVDARHTHGGF
jgi:hypothetical protein